MTEPDGLASGKFRNFSQRVGTGGELSFRNFAHRQGLLGTKVEEDFGIDFMCQVDLDHQSHKTSNIASTVVGACVRATASTLGAVYIYPGDARNLLNSGTPLVFILVHVTSEPDRALVYHRLVDEVFIHELHEFLDAGTSRLEVTPGSCKAEKQFRASLNEMISFGYSQRVRVAVAEARVNSVLPNTTVEVRTGADDQLTLVSTVDYASLFERIDDEQERDLLHAVFGAEEYVTDRIAKLNLRPEVIGYLRSLPQPILFAGLTREVDSSLRATLNGESASEPFKYIAIGSHFGFVHAVGISLIVSRARDRDGVLVHEMELYVDPMATSIMEDVGQTLDFFALCSSGAKIYRGDHDPDTIDGFDVDAMFTPLRSAAAMIKAWQTCAQLDGWPPRSVELRHFTDPEVFNTLIGFAQLLDEPASISSCSFMFGASGPDTAVTDLERSSSTIYLPIIGNLADQSLILHLIIEGSTVAFGGRVVGFEFRAIRSARCEVRDRAEKSTLYPELVLGVGAPTLALGVDGRGSLPRSMEDIRLGWEG